RAVAAEKKERDRATEAETNLARALNAEKEANTYLERSEENLKLARNAIDECFNVAREHPLFQEPRMQGARKVLFEKTLPFYKNFRAQKPDDRRLQWEEAGQWFRVAYIEDTLGKTDEAQEAYRTSRAKYAALVEAHPGVPGYQSRLAATHNNLGGVL